MLIGTKLEGTLLSLLITQAFPCILRIVKCLFIGLLKFKSNGVWPDTFAGNLILDLSIVEHKRKPSRMLHLHNL